MSHIFISYARKDQDRANKIVEALAKNDIDTWIDWKSIPKGEDWELEIDRGVEEADAILFLISPRSVQSPGCIREIDHAVKNGKRILPIVLYDTDPNLIPPEISKRNWSFCREGQDDFTAAINEIHEKIQSNYQWLQYHRHLLVKALKWDRAKDAGLLLRGKGLREAEKQLAKHVEDPQLTDLQRDYVDASRKDVERKRKLLIVSLVAGLITVISLGVYKNDQSILAKQRAIVARAEELAARSADLRKSDITVSMLLGVEAFRIHESLQTLSAVRDNAQDSQLNISWQGSVKTPDDSPIPTNIVYSVAISPDGKTIASGSQDGLITLWNMETGQVIGHPLSGHSERVKSVAFSPDGKLLATGSQDKTIILWNVESEEMVTQLVSTQDGVAGIDRLSFSPDGRFLASDIGAGTVIWDIGSRQVFDVLSEERIRSITNTIYNPIKSTTFSPDGKFLAVCSGSGILLWEVNSKQLVEDQFSASCSMNMITYSPDGKYLAGGYGDVVILWNTETGEAIGEPLRGHSGTVESVAFSPDRKTLASAGLVDNTIFLWDVETGRSIGQPLKEHSDGIYSIVFSPDGKKLISGSRDETVIIWDLDPRSLIQKTCQHVGRNFTQSEWQLYFPGEGYHLTCPQWPPGD